MSTNLQHEESNPEGWSGLSRGEFEGGAAIAGGQRGNCKRPPCSNLGRISEELSDLDVGIRTHGA